MFLRALFSWFPISEDNKLLIFLYCITEPMIQPIRALCNRMNWFVDLPLDVPFFLTYLILAILSTIL